MFQLNDVIVYENGGVCTIKDIGVPEFLHTDIPVSYTHLVRCYEADSGFSDGFYL